MPKYSYRPVLAKVEETYLENAKQEYKAPIDIESSVRLVVEADSQELSDKSIIGFVDIRMWELENESQ